MPNNNKIKQSSIKRQRRVSVIIRLIVAVLLIAPIDDVNRAIRATLQIHRNIAWIRCEHEVGATVHRLIS